MWKNDNAGIFRLQQKISNIYSFIFQLFKHILLGMEKEGCEIMWESDDPNADLDDLIFEEEDGQPSQR